MARLVLVPTERAAEHFDLDPLTHKAAPARMNTEADKSLVPPFVGQRISRNDVMLEVISVSESPDEDGATVYQAVVDVTG